MTLDLAVDLVRETLMLVLMLSLPILLVGLLIGLVVSVFQAMTQIQEQTLSLVPRMVGMAAAAILAAPWAMRMLTDFAQRMFGMQ